MARKKKTKYEKVAKYLSDHPLSAPKNVAKACKCSVKYVYNIRSQSGTPKEVFEREAEANTKTFAVSDRTRSSLLKEAESLITGDREQEHGAFDENAINIARYWNAHLCASDSFITAQDVPIMLALMKLARSINKPEVMDNYRDAAGYIALAGELCEQD